MLKICCLVTRALRVSMAPKKDCGKVTWKKVKPAFALYLKKSMHLLDMNGVSNLVAELQAAWDMA